MSDSEFPRSTHSPERQLTPRRVAARVRRSAHAIARRAAIPPRRAVAAAAYALLLVSCESPFSPSEVTVAEIQTTPISATLTVGETRAVTARVLDDKGSTISDRRLFWSSQNPAVATVSQQGIIAGVGAGATQVAVSAGGKSALVTITVNSRPVSLVRVTPSTATLVAGTTTQLTAEALDAGGSAVGGRPAIWATSDETVATVTSTGLVSGVAAGAANITATIDGVVGTSVLTVQPVPVASVSVTPATEALIVGQQLQLAATPRDSTGLPLGGRAIAWTSNAPTIASVSSTGVVTALSAGTATISASSEGKIGSARITVSLVPIDTISVTPRTSTVAAGQLLQLAVRVVDSTGAPLTGRTLVWNTDQPTIATVSATGLVTALGAGRATITASAEGKSGSATVTVTPVPVASVSILPEAASILIGNSQQFTATARDAANNLLPGRSITWISGAPSVATVTQSGLVTAVGAGSALIFAASEGVSASVTVTVTTIGVARVRVTPTTGTVQQGKQLQMTAQPEDAGGGPIIGRTVTWNSSAPSVASVSSTGQVTGIIPGTANITATVEGVVGTSTITVTAIPVARVTIVPANPTITVGQSLTLTALLADGAGTPLSPAGRNISWTSAAPAIATVSLTGVVTALTQGTTAIQASVEGVSDRTTVTVTSVPVARVTLSPSSASLNVGQTQSVSATALDASGGVLVGRPVTWSSNNVSVATVNTSSTDSSNTIVAVGAGTATISASVGGILGIASVTVSSVPIASLSVTPPTATLTQGSTQQLTVTARDAAGNILTGRSFSYISSAATTASVSATGLVTAVAPGAATITVTPLGASTPTAVAAITVTPVPVASLVLNPAAQSITVGTSQQIFFPSLFDASGNPLSLSGRVISWTSLDPGTATVGATTGVVTGVSVPAGGAPARIVASTAGATGPVADTSLVTVTSVPVTSVTIVEGATATVHLGVPYARTLHAIARDASGNILSRPISWASVTQSVALADVNLGVITGVGTGTSQIIASSAGIADTILVTVDLVPVGPLSTVSLSTAQPDSVVASAGQSRTYTATPRDSAGNVISGAALGGRVPTWSVTSGLATVAGSSASAIVTPTIGASGVATISAAYATATPTTALKVLVPARTVLLQLSPDSVLVGTTAALTATVVDASNVPIPGRVVRMSSANVALASLAATTGAPTLNTTLTAVSAPAGRNQVTLVGTAPFDSLSGSSALIPLSTPVTVLAPVASVAVTTPPGNDSIFVTGTVAATATLRDANNNTLAGRVVQWSTGNALVATAAQNGVVTGVAAGATTIIARESVSGVSGSKALLVQEPVNAVVISAADSSIFVGQTQPTTVTLTDRLGGPLTGRVVTYNSTNPSVATISSSGVISAVGVGTTNITASSEGKTSAVLPFTVNVVPVRSVSVTATLPPNFYPTNTAPATVQAFDSVNNALSLTGRAIAWTSSAPSIATVAAGSPGSATITAVAVGTATVSVTVDGVAATTPIAITVKSVPVVSIAVTPTSGAMLKGDTAVVFTATPLDSANNPLTGRTLAWSSTVSPSKVTVVDAATGRLAAIDSGSTTVTVTAPGAGVGGSSPSATVGVVISLPKITSISLSPSPVVLPSTTGSATLTVTVTGGTPVRPLSGRACVIPTTHPEFTVTPTGTFFTDAAGKVVLTITGVSPTASPVQLTVTCDPGTAGATVVSTNVTVP